MFKLKMPPRSVVDARSELSSRLPSVSQFVPSPAQRRFVAAIHDGLFSANIGEVCDRAHISRTTFYRWRENADFRIWLGNAWMGLLVADNLQLINFARAKAPQQVGFWKLVYKLTVEDPAKYVNDCLAASEAYPVDASLIPDPADRSEPSPANAPLPAGSSSPPHQPDNPPAAPAPVGPRPTSLIPPLAEPSAGARPANTSAPAPAATPANPSAPAPAAPPPPVPPEVLSNQSLAPQNVTNLNSQLGPPAAPRPPAQPPSPAAPELPSPAPSAAQDPAPPPPPAADNRPVKSPRYHDWRRFYTDDDLYRFDVRLCLDGRRAMYSTLAGLRCWPPWGTPPPLPPAHYLPPDSPEAREAANAK